MIQATHSRQITDLGIIVSSEQTDHLNYRSYLHAWFLLIATSASAQVDPAFSTLLDQQAKGIEAQVIDWRRHFHENPELSNREYNTGKYIAEFLKTLDLEVNYPMAKTGVVAILKGAKPGPVIALRADMDALPVTERNGLPFMSKVTAKQGETTTGVMHACGHDSHMAILMGVASILSKNRNKLKGTIKFIFQPAEEDWAPGDTDGGAHLLVKEGVLENPKVDAIFGLHIQSMLPSGQIAYRAEGLMAAVDGFDITVKGVGAHGATPWDGVDPVVLSSQIVMALQTIVSRQVNITKTPAVITVATIHGGVRRNIIPETVTIQGTIRTFDSSEQRMVHDAIRRTVKGITESAGATAAVDIQVGSPLTYNDPKLTAMMAPSLARTAGANLKVTPPVTMAEDFSFYTLGTGVPGLFFFLGAYPADMQLAAKPVHHTSDFMLDEKAFVTGVRALLHLSTDYLFAPSTK
jgi:amidohydrolase